MSDIMEKNTGINPNFVDLEMSIWNLKDCPLRCIHDELYQKLAISHEKDDWCVLQKANMIIRHIFTLQGFTYRQLGQTWTQDKMRFSCVGGEVL